METRSWLINRKLQTENWKSTNFLTLAMDLVICFTWFSLRERPENPLDN